MRTSKKYEKSALQLKGNIPSMLKKARTVLSGRQYRELCTAVNNADGYINKKGMILKFHRIKI